MQPEYRGAKVLYSGRPTNGSGVAAVYTCPSNRRAKITEFIVCNVTGSGAADINLNIDDDGTTYDDDNVFWHANEVAQDVTESYMFEHGLELAPGGSVGAENLTANGLCLIIIGYEMDIEVGES